MHIKGPEILNMWLGESERMVREVFQTAREKRKEGFLPFIFIDEAESILGTRRSSRHANILSTLVPMFCTEMDGIASLRDVVVILASNRADLIDPAILRPGRIDRKIRVRRPDKEGARDIYRIYLTESLPYDPALISESGSAAEAARSLVDRVVDAQFERTDATRFLTVTLRSGRKELLHRGDLVSGALIASVVERAKATAIQRAIKQGNSEPFLALDDLLAALDAEYRENDIFPPSEVTEDWLQLIDYDPENVVRVEPIRSDRLERARRATGVI
jgi:proteasome-associated ATPase